MTGVPSRMRAAVLTFHGGPEAVELRTVPTPTPRPGEVLVRVAAAATNNTDLWTRDGAYGTAEDPAARSGWRGPVAFPRIQGGDVAGTVVALGDGADPALDGRRVLVDPALYGSDDAEAPVVDILGSERDGGFAEYVVVPASCVYAVDESPLSDAELASLPIAYGTALGMVERGGVGEGDTVLVTGASGGVGLAAVQLAVARGARVVAVSSGDKVAGVRQAGADVVVDRRRGAVLDDVRDAAPDGLDVVVDVVAGDLVGPGLDLLRDAGRWVVAGALDGYAVTLDVRRLYLRNLSLVGSTMHTRRMFGMLADLARRGDVRPVVARTFPLDDLHRGHAELAQRIHVGKLVVVP